MKPTYKKHFHPGHTVTNKDCHQWLFTVKNIGIVVIFRPSRSYLSIKLYKLV